MNIYPILLTCTHISIQFSQAVYLFNPWFRFEKKISVAILLILSIYDVLSNNPMFGLSTLALAISTVAVHIIRFLMARTNYLTIAITIEMIYLFLYNAIGNLTIVIVMLIRRLIAGTDSESWFVSTTRTNADIVIQIIAMIFACIAACLISKKCVRLLEMLKKSEQILLCAGLAVPMLAFLFFSRLTVDSPDDLLGGILVILFGVLMTFMAVCLIIFVIIVLKRIRKENLAIQMRMKEDNLNYQKVVSLQEELREARHDLLNQMAAETLSEQIRKEQEKK